MKNRRSILLSIYTVLAIFIVVLMVSLVLPYKGALVRVKLVVNSISFTILTDTEILLLNSLKVSHLQITGFDECLIPFEKLNARFNILEEETRIKNEHIIDHNGEMRIFSDEEYPILVLPSSTIEELYLMNRAKVSIELNRIEKNKIKLSIDNDKVVGKLKIQNSTILECYECKFEYNKQLISSELAHLNVVSAGIEYLKFSSSDGMILDINSEFFNLFTLDNLKTKNIKFIKGFPPSTRSSISFGTIIFVNNTLEPITILSNYNLIFDSSQTFNISSFEIIDNEISITLDGIVDEIMLGPEGHESSKIPSYFEWYLNIKLLNLLAPILVLLQLFLIIFELLTRTKKPNENRKLNNSNLAE